MAQGNGHTQDMNVPLLRPDKTVDFRIGGQKIPVPVLTLWDLDRIKPINDVMDTTNWISYSKDILKIVSLCLEETRPDLTHEYLSKACTIAEARDTLWEDYYNLLIESGLVDPNASPQEAATESPGTGTQTGSPPTLPSEESAEAIQTSSSEPLLSNNGPTFIEPGNETHQPTG